MSNAAPRADGVRRRTAEQEGAPHSMTNVIPWLFAHPLRAAIVNILLFCTLLALTGAPPVIIVLSGCAALFAAGHFLWRAWHARRADGPFGIALTWVPGVLAIALLPLAVALVVQGGIAAWLGLSLLAGELALLALATTDAAPRSAA
jgi:hypothetical protein